MPLSKSNLGVDLDLDSLKLDSDDSVGSSTTTKNVPIGSGKGLSKSKLARLQKRAIAEGQKSSTSSSTTGTLLHTTTAPSNNAAIITATSQQSRFYRETLDSNNTDSTGPGAGGSSNADNNNNGSHNSKEVDVKGVNISIGDREVLVDAHLRLKSGMRYGMIGQNGVGKSLLMHVLGNRILSGLPDNVKFVYIKQLEDVDSTSKRTILEEVLSADEERERIIFEAKLLQDVSSTSSESIHSTIHKLLLSRSEHNLKRARQIAEKTSGQRGYNARQTLLQVEQHHRYLLSSSPSSVIVNNDEGEETMIGKIVDEVLGKYACLDVDGDVVRARTILRGLGFKEEEINGKDDDDGGDNNVGTVGRLSGGWKMRVGLAKALFVKPDVLLLDEPTNHLDLPAILWLENYLTKKTQGQTVLIVSHDRRFLDKVTEETVIFKDKALKYHAGNYEDWERNTEEQRKRKTRLKELEMKRKEKIEMSIQKSVARAKSTGDDKRLGMVASRKKKLERMGMERLEDGKRFQMSKHGYYREEIVIEQGFKTTPIHLPPPEPYHFPGQTFLQLDEVSFRYKGGKKNVINQVSLDIGPGTRIGLLGPNGCGKSTLMNLLAGVLEPTKGQVKKHHRLRIGYFSQHTVDQLNLGLTPLEHLQERYPTVTISEGEARAHFGTCGVSGEPVTRPIGTLSGGERNRVALGLITFERPHVLLLDEITNHLDMGTVESLVESLCEFEGALVVVSHDVWFLGHVVEEFYRVKGSSGTVTKWSGGLDRPRPPVVFYSTMSLLKGKGTDVTWVHLPQELVRHIATLYLWDRATTAYVPNTWDHPELWHNRMVFQSVRDAFDLERSIMSVCPSWGLALESHLFWQQAITLIDPTDSLPHHTYRLSPYRHFRHILSCSCLVCRINLPTTTRGLMLAKRSISSFLLGPIPLCREHDHRRLSFCGLCLRESFHLPPYHNHNHHNHHNALITNTHSISENEDQDTFPGVEATCRTCRTEWLLKKALSSSSHSSQHQHQHQPQPQQHQQLLPALGGMSLVSEDWETRQSVDGFVELGEGCINDVFTLAKEKWWLRRWTRLGDMLQQALAAKRFNSNEAVRAQGMAVWDNGVVARQQLRQQQLQKLDDKAEQEEEEEEDEEEDEEEEDTELMQLEEGGVKDLALGDWARTRILDGYWISPADLWYRHSIPGKPLDTPALHPCPWTLPSSQQQQLHNRVQHPSKETTKADIPPSFTLCEQAFLAHGQQLRLILLPPMKNIVRRVAIECALVNSSLHHHRDRDCGDEDPTLKISKMSLEDVVRMLREEEGVWFDGYDWIERRKNELMAESSSVNMRMKKSRGDDEEDVSSPTSTTSGGSSTTASTTSAASTGRGTGREGGGEGDSSVGSNTTSPVLSTTTLQTTPSPPPITDDHERSSTSKPHHTNNNNPTVSTTTKSSHDDKNQDKKPIVIDDNDDIYTEITNKLLIPVDPVLNPPRILRSIPFIPTTIMHLPQYSLDAVKNVWREACSPLYHCRCRICERAVAAVNAKATSTGTVKDVGGGGGGGGQYHQYHQQHQTQRQQAHIVVPPSSTYQREVPPHRKEEVGQQPIRLSGGVAQHHHPQHHHITTIQLDEVSEIEYGSENDETTTTNDDGEEEEEGGRRRRKRRSGKSRSEEVEVYAYGYDEDEDERYEYEYDEDEDDGEDEDEGSGLDSGSGSGDRFGEGDEVEGKEEMLKVRILPTTPPVVPSTITTTTTTAKENGRTRKRSLDEIEDENGDENGIDESNGSGTPTKRLRKSLSHSHSLLPVATLIQSPSPSTTRTHGKKRSSEELDDSDDDDDDNGCSGGGGGGGGDSVSEEEEEEGENVEDEEGKKCVKRKEQKKKKKKRQKLGVGNVVLSGRAGEGEEDVVQEERVGFLSPAVWFRASPSLTPPAGQQRRGVQKGRSSSRTRTRSTSPSSSVT